MICFPSRSTHSWPSNPDPLRWTSDRPSLSGVEQNPSSRSLRENLATDRHLDHRSTVPRGGERFAARGSKRILIDDCNQGAYISSNPWFGSDRFSCGNETMADAASSQDFAHRRLVERRLDSAGWGLFFIWIGIALFLDVGWAIGLFGVGIIMLGAQTARKYMALKVDAFGVVLGSLFVLGGIWEWFKIQVGLVPILLIAVGLVLLISALVKKQTG